MLLLGGMLIALALLVTRDRMQPAPRELAQDDIDAAVLHTLENKTLPSRAAKAAAAVMPSVVRVRGYDEDDEPGAGERMNGVGSGVVIVDNGTILTNLHVVTGAKRLSVTFFDGTESEVEVIRAYPENDLAVIRAKKLPDDLQAATLGSTALQQGDEVVAIGLTASGIDQRRCGFRTGSRISLARRQAHFDRLDSVRRRRQPGQLGRAAGHDERRSDRHRDHRPSQPNRADLRRHRLRRDDRKRRRVLSAFLPFKQGIPWTITQAATPAR